MINIILNGLPAKVEEGITILEVSRFYGFPVPTLCHMDGLSSYGACRLCVVEIEGQAELVEACDLRIMSEQALIGQPEVKLGLVPGLGGTQRLPRMLPWCKAAEILLLGKPIDAQEAYRIGLVNKIVPPEAVLPTAKEWAETICQAGPLAVRAAKEAMVRGSSMTLEEGLQLENTLNAYLFGTEDFVEGITSFVEKRPPNYKAK